MTRAEGEIIAESIYHLTRLSEHLDRADIADDTVFDAVCMRLSAAVESLSGLDEARRVALFGNDWRAMWGMRNRIAHGYVGVDRASIEATVNDELPELLSTLVALAAQLPTEPTDDPK